MLLSLAAVLCVSEAFIYFTFFSFCIAIIQTAETVAVHPFNSGFNKVKTVASEGYEALLIGKKLAIFVHKAARSYTG